MKNKITEMNNTLEGTDNRLNEAEDGSVGITTSEQKTEERIKRNEDSLRALWDNTKRSNIHTAGVPKRGTREEGPGKLCGGVATDTSPAWERTQSPTSRKRRELHTGSARGDSSLRNGPGVSFYILWSRPCSTGESSFLNT